MNLGRELLKAMRATLALWILTAVFYPLLILLVGQGLFPFQANGSLVSDRQNKTIGSALIGQSFTSNRYFWSRPSAIDYSSGKDAPATGLSGASNLAPSNPELAKRIEEKIADLKREKLPLNADLLYTSGSGLDPHITLESAKAQIERVAMARRLTQNQVESLMAKNIDSPFLRIFGEPGVNILRLNLALDNL